MYWPAGTSRCLQHFASDRASGPIHPSMADSALCAIPGAPTLLHNHPFKLIKRWWSKSNFHLSKLTSKRYFMCNLKYLNQKNQILNNLIDESQRGRTSTAANPPWRYVLSIIFLPVNDPDYSSCVGYLLIFANENVVQTTRLQNQTLSQMLSKSGKNLLAGSGTRPSPWHISSPRYKIPPFIWIPISRLLAIQCITRSLKIDFLLQ